MEDIYVLNKNLERIGVVDFYKSCIWAKRYDEIGDCELYLEATIDNLNLLQKGYYLERDDDDMICQIKSIEIDTDSENGNYLTVMGYDVKRILDQRIIWSTMNVDSGNLETFIRTIVDKTLCTPNLYARQAQKEDGSQLLFLGDLAGFTEVITEQVSYKNVGEKVRDYCKTYGWGYRVVLSNSVFWFQLFKGDDKSSNVVFSENYENLITSKYSEDETNMGNVALVAGEGEGSERSRNVAGYAEGLDRYEIFVDAKDISKTITWEDLTELFPTTDKGGQGYIASASGSYVYKLNYLNVQIVDSDQLTWLKTNYPSGQEVTIGGIQYYQVYNEIVADLPSNSPQSSDNVTLRDIVYSVYLLNRGYEKMAEYGAVTTFDGTIEPRTTFIYKQDYNLGDIVAIESRFGISVNARITEIVEVKDDNGYSVEPKFEYISIN